MSSIKLSIVEIVIIVLEIILVSAGIIVTMVSLPDNWLFLQYIGIPCSIISISMLLIAFQIKGTHNHLQDNLYKERQKSEGLYSKLDNYLTLGELNDLEQKFGEKGNIDIYIASNDLSTETKEWKKIIEKNLRNKIKYYYITNDKNKEHFNALFKDLKEKWWLKNRNLEENFSISLNNCLFKFLPKFSEIVIYRNNNKSPIEMRCFTSYTNNGEKELYKEMDAEFSDTIWRLINDCINNSLRDNCVDCNHPDRCKKHNP